MTTTNHIVGLAPWLGSCSSSPVGWLGSCSSLLVGSGSSSLVGVVELLVGQSALLLIVGRLCSSSSSRLCSSSSGQSALRSLLVDGCQLLGTASHGRLLIVGHHWSAPHCLLIVGSAPLGSAPHCWLSALHSSRLQQQQQQL